MHIDLTSFHTAELLRGSPLEESAEVPVLGVKTASNNHEANVPDNRELATSGDQRACKWEVAGSTREAVVALALSIVGQPIWFCTNVNGVSACNTPSYTCPVKAGGQPRWYGIDAWICPVNLKVSPCADCSSFVTWLFWTAYGLGADKLNGANPKWTSGYTGSMMSRGVKIDKTLWKTKIQPGDLVFLSGHIQIYVGNSEVVEIKGAGVGSYMTTVQKNPITWSKVIQVNSYFGTSANLF